MMSFFRNIFFIITILQINYSINASEVDSIDAIAYVSFKQAKYDKAYEYYSKLILLKPEEERYYIKRGEISFILNNYEKAIEDFMIANKLKTASASINLARIYSLKNNYQNSLIYLEQHLKSKYKLPEIEIKTDSCFKNMANSNEWLMLWKKEWYTEKEKKISEVKYLIRYEKYFDALDIVNKEIKNNASVWYFMRAQIFSYMQQYKAANIDYIKAINKAPNNIDYIYEYALMLLKAKEFSKSAEYFFQVIEKQPYRVDIYKYIGQCYYKLKKYNEACLYYEKYIAYFDTDYEALYDLGRCYIDAAKYFNAMKIFNKLIKYNEFEPKYYISRGEAYLKANSYNYAEKDLSMALDFSPNNSEIYLLRGLARLRQGNTEGACRDWKMAESLGNLHAIVYQSTYCNSK